MQLDGAKARIQLRFHLTDATGTAKQASWALEEGVFHTLRCYDCADIDYRCHLAGKPGAEWRSWPSGRSIRGGLTIDCFMDGVEQLRDSRSAWLASRSLYWTIFNRSRAWGTRDGTSTTRANPTSPKLFGPRSRRQAKPHSDAHQP